LPARLEDIARLHPADIEAIAARVAVLLQERAPVPAARLVDAATLAAILGVERDWVYTHAEQLRGVRLGGPRGRLRFDLAAVFRSLDGPAPAQPRRHASGAKSLPLGGESLPIDP
jgi:hypothetical protein